jgi:hypothetical protein
VGQLIRLIGEEFEKINFVEKFFDKFSKNNNSTNETSVEEEILLPEESL